MEEFVEFDRKKLEAALRSGLNLNDCNPEDLNSLKILAEEEIEEELELEDATLDLAALGAEYRIGELDFNMVLGNLALLHVIDSPFMTELEEDAQLSFDQCCEALYVLYKGKDAVEPIMHIQQKIKDMLMLKSLVAKNPEMIDRLLDRVEKISEARSEFTQSAREFYLEHFKQNELQDVVERMVAILSDSVNSMAPPREDQNIDTKKTSKSKKN